jgi:ribosomal protein S8
MDTIANMLTSLKNANDKFKDSVDIPSSKLKVEIARVLKEEGLVVGYIKHPFDCDLCILFFNDYRVGTYITTTHAKQALLKKYNQITLK